MSINATQSHSGEHLVAKKAVCNPEICLEKKQKKKHSSQQAVHLDLVSIYLSTYLAKL